MLNSLTAALHIDERNPDEGKNFVHDRRLTQNEDVFNLCERNGISCRTLKTKDDRLHEGEWIIALFGFIDLHRNYNGLVDEWGYQFIYKENGVWLTRTKETGDKIVEAEKDIFEKYEKKGYPACFYALSWK